MYLIKLLFDFLEIVFICLHLISEVKLNDSVSVTYSYYQLCEYLICIKINMFIAIVLQIAVVLHNAFIFFLFRYNSKYVYCENFH